MPSRPSLLRLGAIILSLILKFWLVSGSPISDAKDDPREYVNQILHPTNEGIAYGPGTGLLGRLFLDLGLPFRWGIEAVFILALVLVLKALFDWPTRSTLTAALFVFVLLDPAITSLFSRLMSDQIWMVETMIGFSLLVLALDRPGRPRWWLLGLGALSLGFSAITRSTFMPLMLDLAAFALLGYLLLFRNNKMERRASLAVFSLSLWTLLLGVGIVYGGTCWYNARCYGFSGISALDSREYKNFYLTLQSVGPPTGVRYFPIDEDRRKWIAQAGPTSKWFIAQIETKTYYKDIGLEYYGRSDFAAGWFHFAVFNVVLNATHGNLRQSFALLKTIEQEITDAGRRGTIPVRTILPLPDSRLGIVFPQLPRALVDTLSRIAHEPPPDWLKQNADHASTSDADFTRALLRQPAHATPAQERTEWLLAHFYALVYPPLLLVFPFVFLIALRGYYLARSASFSLPFIARQLFALTFLVMIGWYALFDASGLPVLPRYMIYHHVLLPVLIAFYLVEIRRLAPRNRLAA